jgi:WXG100 family type VII secretion target
MGKIIVDTVACRREAERLRKAASEIENIKSRLTNLIGDTSDVWQGVAAGTLSESQEYTLKEFARLVMSIEEAAADVERIATEFEQAERNITGGLL